MKKKMLGLLFVLLFAFIVVACNKGSGGLSNQEVLDKTTDALVKVVNGLIAADKSYGFEISLDTEISIDASADVGVLGNVNFGPAKISADATLKAYIDFVDNTKTVAQGRMNLDLTEIMGFVEDVSPADEKISEMEIPKSIDLYIKNAAVYTVMEFYIGETETIPVFNYEKSSLAGTPFIYGSNPLPDMLKPFGFNEGVTSETLNDFFDEVLSGELKFEGKSLLPKEVFEILEMLSTINDINFLANSNKDGVITSELDYSALKPWLGTTYDVVAAWFLDRDVAATRAEVVYDDDSIAFLDFMLTNHAAIFNGVDWLKPADFDEDHLEMLFGSSDFMDAFGHANDDTYLEYLDSALLSNSLANFIEFYEESYLDWLDIFEAAQPAGKGLNAWLYEINPYFMDDEDFLADLLLTAPAITHFNDIYAGADVAYVVAEKAETEEMIKMIKNFIPEDLSFKASIDLSNDVFNGANLETSITISIPKDVLKYLVEFGADVTATLGFKLGFTFAEITAPFAVTVPPVVIEKTTTP